MKEHGDYVPFQIESLAAIYLGCRVATLNVGRVLDLVTGERHPADVYLAIKDDSEFALSFVPLSNGRARTPEIPIMDNTERGRLYRRSLDAYFDFWNDPDEDLYGALRRLRSEGALADYGPPDSLRLFREMILNLENTYAAKPTISVDEDEAPEEYKNQRLDILRPSAKIYGELEDLLKADLARRGGTLPDRKHDPEL